MLEEKNDNLQEADGNLGSDSLETTQSETPVLEIVETTESNTTEKQESVEVPIEAISEGTPLADINAAETENQTIVDAIADTNAEESEDETKQLK